MDAVTGVLKQLTGISEWIMLIIIIGGGLFLVGYSRFRPYRHFRHAIGVVSGKYDKAGETGEVSHFQALASVVAATVGLGNISGVAIAIYSGGPGVVFWMWLTAVLGACIKFYSCGLAVLYREVDDKGQVKGGPMYYMKIAMGRKGKILAVFFCLAGLFGVLPAFTVNQLTQTIVEVVNPDSFYRLGELKWRLIIGIVLVVLTSMVIFGGLKKIVRVASAMVPFMVLVYFLSALLIMVLNPGQVWPSVVLIFREAFDLHTAVQGGFWGLVLLGVQRAVFSNESGIGNAPMYHGQSRTDEPAKEGLVAMLGPFIDTIVVCTITAIIIIISGAHETTETNGIVMTLNAFEKLLFGYGDILLMVMVFVFALSTLFTYSYYGTKCLTFLGGEKVGKAYNYVYIFSIIFVAMASVDFVVSLIDLAFALMAIPNMIAVLWLAPDMNRSMNRYFKKLKEEKLS
ncbi:alanine/glycine:cation symporter family protein [Sinomicrobium soli]|uniref:alanine/glycine:cation symporter family protein n=1 Tax=Sinomicrobium sp. N-1-3-6 TaxID=2219864 RepID=UPI000DCF3443|nr:alanine/glycine:cation symporter family protein [Sinomicrobium sp. N-1-3-6]RAV28029.1 sodium/alanine symporter [Sinomicrobium sp. N-1-3-6]